MADDVQVQFGAEAGQLIDSLSQVRFALQGLSNPIRGIRDNLGELGEAFIAAFAVHEIDHFVEAMTNIAVQTQRASVLLGVSTGQVAGLNIAAEAGGGSLQELTSSMERLGLSLARADAGSKQAVAGLQALGISAAKFRALKPEQQIEMLADKFSVLKDGIDKDAIAMAILGRGGAALLPVLNGGAAAFQEFQAKAERAGSAMSKDTVKGFEATHLRLIELGKSFQGIGITLMSTFKPAIDGVIKVITDLVQGLNNASKEGGALRPVLLALEATAQGLAIAFAVSVAAVETLWEVIKDFVFVVGQSFMSLGRIIKDVFTLNLSDAKAAWSELGDSLVDRAKITSANMESVMRTMMAKIKTTLGTGADDEVHIAQTKSARLQMLNSADLGARLKSIDDQVRAEEEKLKRLVTVLDGEEKRNEITQNQKFAAVEQYTNDAFNAEMALLQQKEVIARADVKMHADVLSQIAKLQQTHDTEMVKLDEQALDAASKQWNTFFSTLTSSFNGNIRGLLEGTTTWQKAMLKTLEDLTIKAIEWGEKMAVQWIANEAAKTTATTTGAAVRTGAEATSSSAGILSGIANALRSIFASGGQTAAEVSAEVAPAVGPAAPAVGAAAGAAVIATATSIGKFDVGTDRVLKGGLAILHENEKVLPAAVASGAFTGAGMGTTVHQQTSLNISAMDSRSIERFFQDNDHHVVKAFNRAVKNGAHLNLR